MVAAHGSYNARATHQRASASLVRRREEESCASTTRESRRTELFARRRAEAIRAAANDGYCVAKCAVLELTGKISNIPFDKEAWKKAFIPQVKPRPVSYTSEKLNIPQNIMCHVSPAFLDSNGKATFYFPGELDPLFSDFTRDKTFSLYQHGPAQPPPWKKASKKPPAALVARRARLQRQRKAGCIDQCSTY
jgi:hypothetical protein